MKSVNYLSLINAVNRVSETTTSFISGKNKNLADAVCILSRSIKDSYIPLCTSIRRDVRKLLLPEWIADFKICEMTVARKITTPNDKGSIT